MRQATLRENGQLLVNVSVVFPINLHELTCAHIDLTIDADPRDVMFTERALFDQVRDCLYSGGQHYFDYHYDSAIIPDDTTYDAVYAAVRQRLAVRFPKFGE